MRICYIGWAQYIHLQRFANWFASHGHEVHVITNFPVDLENVKMYNIRTPEEWDSSFFRRNALVKFIYKVSQLKSYLREIKPDILHSQSLYYPAFLGAFVGFQPYVVTVWNGDILFNRVGDVVPHSLYKKKIQQLINHFALSRAQIVTGVSETLIREVRNRGVSPQKTKLIHWGVDPCFFHPVSNKGFLKQKLKIGDEKIPIILCTRNLDSLYNIETILEVIPQIKSSFPKARFVFLWNADNNKLGSYKQLVKRLGVDSSVQWVGPVSYAQIHEYYQAADIFVSVASYDSGPISMVEAMACGAAPVMSRLPSIMEWVEDGVNGFLVKPRDRSGLATAIVELLKDGTLRNQFAQRNEELIREKANHDFYMRKMEAIYYSLIRSQS